jgi:hypothetical protein
VEFTHGPKAAVAPKYCSKPIKALRSAANSQAAKTHLTSVSFCSRSDRKPNSKASPPAQAQEKSSGTTVGDGPKVNGLSQGKVRRMNTAAVCIDVAQKSD